MSDAMPSCPIGCACRPARGLAADQRIPRTIHQTHKLARAALPAGLQNATTTWEELNLDYEYRYYDDRGMQSYVDLHGGDVRRFREAYKIAASGAMRCDLWRYLLIWREGGVYADADAVLRQPLRSLIHDDDDGLAGFGQDALEQHVLAYAPRHPIIGRVLHLAISDVLRLNRPLWSLEVIKYTGPLQLCRAVREWLETTRLGDDPDACRTQFHLAPRLGSGVYLAGPRRARPANASERSLRILPGHHRCHGAKPPYRGSTWSPTCALGRIADCPCVYRSDEQLASLYKYDRKQYQADLRVMGAEYYMGGKG